MAETTPGPLTQVVQFVGFIGAFRLVGEPSPLAAGLLASIVVTWVTFVLCFLWIFLGAPYMERLNRNLSFKTALTAVTAVVVGVILNLAVWFSFNTLFGHLTEQTFSGIGILIPTWNTLDLPALIIAAAACFVLFRIKVGLLPALAVSAAGGILYQLILRT